MSNAGPGGDITLQANVVCLPNPGHLGVLIVIKTRRTCTPARMKLAQSKGKLVGVNESGAAAMPAKSAMVVLEIRICLQHVLTAAVKDNHFYWTMP